MASCTIKKRSEESVVHQLNELFGNVLNLDVIKTVAISCRFDVAESSNKLLEITSVSKEDTMEKRKTASLSRSIGAPSVTSKKSRKTLLIERAINYIEEGYKILIIMRGVPGCGKSYLAKSIVHTTIGPNCNFKLHILSTDDFFCQNGVYQYDVHKLSEAHGWNHNRAFNALSKGYSPIIIDNTNTQMWEMKPYAMMATDCGYIIEILEPDTHWCFNDKELAKRNSHGIPRSKIKEMLERYEKNITPHKLLNAYNLIYRLQKPPQVRLYPPLQMESSISTSSVNISTTVPEYPSPVRHNVVKSRSASVLNHETIDCKTETVETIDLMEFNDDETGTNLQPTVEISDDDTSIESWKQDPVDNILMCDSNTTSKAAYVLKPSQQNTTEVIITDESSDEDDQKRRISKNKLFPDLETTWGVTENALRSWDIVTPIKDEANFVKLPQHSINEINIETKDSSCNTEEEYFHILKNEHINSVDFPIKVIDTFSRDINRLTPKREPTISKKTMLDKSCLTDDIFDNYDTHMSQLINLFPNIPESHLKYWYNKCTGDLEWTIEFLLEAKDGINTLIEENDDDKEVDEATQIEVDSDTSNSDSTHIVNYKEKAKRSRKLSDENNEVKKFIESKIDINQEHYSKHLLKIKQFKFGSTSDNLDNSQPSVSNGNQLNCTKTSMPEASTSEDENCMTDTEYSDIEFDDLEFVNYSYTNEETVEEIVEINIGNNLVAQLENKFGDLNMGYPKGFQPVLHIPITIARQLYTFYIESVFQQMETQKQVLETFVKEDEEFARKLQAKEDEQVSSQAKPSSNLREIMDEQVAQSIYQKEAEKWKDLNPDNLAAKLTQQKLFSVFPNVDKNTLVEILHAHENKYHDTIETLLASTETENIRGNIDSIREPPLKEEIIQEMKDAKKNSANKEYKEQHEATFYREEASRYLTRRAELYQKAQQYHQRGMTEVAQFYSGLARQQTIYFDRANNMAATAFLDEHSKRLQDFNTIDLHFLYVKEALPALDLFLDRNINLLKHSTNKQSEYLQIITGRGKRSENGVSKIRPAVIARLKQRDIRFLQLNPGLLKVKLTKNSLVTSEIVS